jgi:hypothetical protein
MWTVRLALLISVLGAVRTDRNSPDIFPSIDFVNVPQAFATGVEVGEAAAVYQGDDPPPQPVP